MNSAGEFFLVALPGLEDIVAAEAADWFPETEFHVEHGGVTAFVPLARGLAMNMALKTPTRILLRVRRFRCRDFPRLYKTVSTIRWADWVNPASKLTVHASTRLSRLKIKSRIEETCREAWAASARNHGVAAADSAKPADLFVRFHNDECTLSLDTSGERLHKRGTRVLIGEAPLRETIAAALIQLVGRGDAGEAEVEIVDPMMGSGVFLAEAGGCDSLTEGREFAMVTAERPSLHVRRPRIVSRIGFEADPKTFDAASANLAGGEGVDLRAMDFFSAEPLPPARVRRWLFCNPPWGERLKVDEPLQALYERLFAACERVARPDRACFLLPVKAIKGKLRLPAEWRVLAKRPFVAGGIPVVAFVFQRR